MSHTREYIARTLRYGFRTLDAPTCGEGCFGVACVFCKETRWYTGPISEEEMTSLVMHYALRHEDPEIALAEIRAERMGEREAPAPRESFPGDMPQVTDAMRGTW
jgi:hypothetical protein